MTNIEALLRATAVVALILLLPSIAAADDLPQARTAGAVTLDAATMAGLGIDDSAPTVASEAARPVKPDTGTWSWTPGAYAYDPSGNITAIGTTQTFVYDRHGRLVDAVVSRTGGTEHRAYTYDRFGNRTGSSAAGTSTPTSTSTNHLTSLSAVYDETGDLTQLQPPNQATMYQYKYDRLGALQEVKASNVAGTPTQLHIYTAGDERLWTFDLSTNTSHWKIRDLGGKVLRDYSVAGTTWSLARDYVYRNGLLLAAVTPTDTLDYSLDHLGTPRVITDAARTRVGFHHYLPFGEEITDETGAQEGEVMKFTGHERDADVVGGGSNGLDYMHARYYAGSLGRFLSVDPSMDLEKILPEPQLWNRYSYVGNNPIRFTDPDGKERLQAYHFNRQPIADRGFKTEMIYTAKVALAVSTMMGIPLPGEALLGRAFGAAGRFLGLGSSSFARGSVLLESAIAKGAVREGGALSKVLGGIEAGFKSGSPKTAEAALEVVAKGAEAAGLKPGTLVEATGGAKYVLQNVGDIKTFIYKTGEVIIKKGDGLLVRYIPK